MEPPAPAPDPNDRPFNFKLVVLISVLLLIAATVEVVAPEYSCKAIVIILACVLTGMVLVNLISIIRNSPNPQKFHLFALNSMRKRLLYILRASELIIDLYVNEKANKAYDAAITILCIKGVFICARMLVVYGNSKYEGRPITNFDGLNQDTILDPYEGLAMYALNRVRDKTVSPIFVILSQGICAFFTLVINEPLDDNDV